jgi:hypothetical protein
MNIRKYIDLNLIDEYAYKSFRNGYSLDVCDIPTNEISNFLDILFKHDYHTRDLILDRMQDLINDRIQMVEFQAKYDAGLIPVQDQINGEVNWIVRRGAA